MSSNNLYAGLWFMDVIPPMNVEMAGGVFDGIPIKGYKTRLFVNTKDFSLCNPHLMKAVHSRRFDF